jgi:hypothetical protein
MHIFASRLHSAAALRTTYTPLEIHSERDERNQWKQSEPPRVIGDESNKRRPQNQPNNVRPSRQSRHFSNWEW